MRPQDVLDAYPGAPPPPTPDDPFVQVKWIFAQRAAPLSADGRENYESGLRHHLKFLEERRGRAPATLQELWGITALIEFKAWVLGPQCKLGSYARVGVVSCLRACLREAVRLDCIKEFANTAMPAGWRETQLHEVYSTDELRAVLEVIRVEHAFSLQVLQDYEPKGGGRDPRDKPQRGQRGSRPSHLGYGWKVADNMRWYFENILDCRPVKGGGPTSSEHRKFLHHAGHIHGGIRELYRRWGVTACIDQDVLSPLVLQLQYLTGLNPFSLITLQTDCLGEHPLLQTTYLSYRKLRSSGDKQLLLDLLNGVRDSLGVGDYVEDRASLHREQALLIERCIGRILKLTAPIRERASPEIAKLLFIYESTAVHSVGKVGHFDLEKVNRWCRRQVDRNDLRADDGSRLSFNLVRFRPTRLTEMAKQGKDYFEIQQFAGHANVRTTVGYIEERTFGSLSDKEIVRALDTIWTNKKEFEASQQTAGLARGVIPVAPFETLMCKCKNVFDPPRQVRDEASYIEGQACTRHNMCLFCDNIILTVNELPYIAYYRSQVRRALAPQSTTDVPHRKLYQKTLSLLEQILDYEDSEFTPEQIDHAIEVSQDVDMVIDWLVYIATEEA